MWRIVKAEIATLHEIETHWSILDLCDAHVVLDMHEDVDRLQAERMKR